MEKKNLSTKFRKAKKAVVSGTSAVMATVMTTITAFAADVDANEFVTKACSVLKTVIILVGFGLALWGVINALEGYSSKNSADRSDGIKQLIGGLGIILVGVILVPVLQTQITNAMG